VGNWASNRAWNGDYTLNTTTRPPFYAAFPTNHVELAAYYDKPLIDWLPKAKTSPSSGASRAPITASIGPLPNGSGDTAEWNQKSCGAFAPPIP